jgi:DNA primase
LTKAGRNFRGLCPFHSEKHPSFFVYSDQQTWHCFGACGTGGDVFSFIMKKQGIGFGDALRLLAQRAGVTLPTKVEAEGGKKERLYQANQAAAQYFHNLLLGSPAGEKARDYAASRGLSPETIANFQLGFSPNSWEALNQYLLESGYTEDELLESGLVLETEQGKRHDRFRSRLMFPISDIRGHTMGFGARALDDSLPKYLNSPQTPIFDKSSSLYAINMAHQAIRQQGQAVIVEGYMDVIIAHQNGFTNVVAPMGTSVTEKQINTIKRLAKTMIFALDADAAGIEAMLRVERTSTEVLYRDVVSVQSRDPNRPAPPLDESQVQQDQKYQRIVAYAGIPDVEVKVLVLPAGKDPDDVIKEDPQKWQTLLEEAIPVVDYTIDTVVSRLDLTTAEGKSSAVSNLLPIIAEIKDAVRREHYLQKLARLVKVSDETLEAALSRIKPERKARQPKQKAIADALRPALSNPIEEYCLSLLLQYPELKAHGQGFSPEYFADTQNREIFVAYLRADEVKSIKEELDSAFHGYIDALLSKALPATQIEPRFAQCALRLREIYLRNLETKKAEALAMAAESGGTNAELAKLEEQGIKISAQLGEVFTQKSQIRPRTKGG